MEQIDISLWVDQETDLREKEFRQAIHTILLAISQCEHLHTDMVMKGGLLIAIRYNSPRYTRDIDFSTNHPYSEFNVDAFRKELDNGLVLAIEELGYGLACDIGHKNASRIQKSQTTNGLLWILQLDTRKEDTEHR